MAKIPDCLNALAEHPENFLLLIDFDGTLVEIVDNPRIVTVPDQLRHNLLALHTHSALAFVIVTGRAVVDIDGFMGGERLPVLGGHGVELRIDPAQPTQFMAEILPETTRQLICGKGQEFGCYVEDKIYSLSLHARDPNIYENLERALADTLSANNLTYRVRRIGRTFEVLQQNLNKGSGIAHLLTLENFGARKLIYIGDDVRSDESLATEITEKGGTLIAVGAGQTPPNGLYFESPAALRSFINTLARRLVRTAEKVTAPI
jgi:trehalose 6-phosphate phosphatase